MQFARTPKARKEPHPMRKNLTGALLGAALAAPAFAQAAFAGYHPPA